MLAERFQRRLASLPRPAIVTSPELIGYLSGFFAPVEEWPVANPVAPVAAVLVVGLRGPVLVVASMYEGLCDPEGPTPRTYRSYDAWRPPAPVGELTGAIGAALIEADVAPGQVFVEEGVPHVVALAAADAGLRAVRLDPSVPDASRPDADLLQATRGACRLADVAQREVARLAEPGRSEAEIAGLAHAAIAAAAGRRLPAILTVTAGAASGVRAGPATERVVQAGDLVLCDVAPWWNGAWSDAATTVCAGEPSRAQQRNFDAVRGALDLAIARCRPGALGREVDRAVREHLEDRGPTYGHHTGHGIGLRWWQEPYLTPYGETPIEEGMVLAAEPALYDPLLGGVRLEHTFLVRTGGNEVLTRYEHRLRP